MAKGLLRSTTCSSSKHQLRQVKGCKMPSQNSLLRYISINFIDYPPLHSTSNPTQIIQTPNLWETKRLGFKLSEKSNGWYSYCSSYCSIWLRSIPLHHFITHHHLLPLFTFIYIYIYIYIYKDFSFHRYSLWGASIWSFSIIFQLCFNSSTFTDERASTQFLVFWWHHNHERLRQNKYCIRLSGLAARAPRACSEVCETRPQWTPALVLFMQIQSDIKNAAYL